MIFRKPFATWVLAFASSNYSKVAFASFRGEYRENKCTYNNTSPCFSNLKESLAHSILITWSFVMSFPQRLATCILAFASFRFGSCENKCRLSLLTFMNQFRHPNTAIDTSYRREFVGEGPLIGHLSFRAPFAQLSRDFRGFPQIFSRTRLWGNENFVLAIPLLYLHQPFWTHNAPLQHQPYPILS